MNEPAVPPADPSAAPGRPPATPRRLPAWALPALLLAVAAALVWQHLELRQRVAATQAEVERRATADTTLAAEVRASLRQGQDALAGLQQKLGAVEARLAEMAAQNASLEGAYQDLARGREEWLLTEIEQLLGLAAQQLQLAGNVQAAVQALATADARLARAQRPQFIALRKAVASDLQRLKALPGVDLAGIALRVENIATGVDAMGLAYDSRPGVAGRAAPAKAAEAAPDAWWQRGLREFWAEVRTLVRIERMDRPEPVVLAPNQIFFLRENLKLRLLSARVELLARDQAAFRAEIKLALQWLEKHFDPRDRRVQGAIDTLRPFLAAEFSIEPPSLAASQAALRAVKLPGERSGR